MEKLEDIEINEEKSFEELLNESEKKTENQTLISGVIVQINEDENQALVDIGQKSEGKLKLDEIKGEDGNLLFNVDDKIDVVVVSNRGQNPTVSYKKAIQLAKVKDLIEKYGNEPEDLVVEVTIKSFNKNKFIATDGELDYTMPAKESYLKRDSNGKKVKAKVLKIKENGNIIISRKKYIDEIKAKKEAIINSILEKNEPVSGIVKKITSYGMFVDLGGVDGLVSYNEISYKGPVNPALYFDEGDEVDVVVKSFDKEKGHISLSVKDAMTNPWEEIKEQLEVGDTVSVIVSNFESYGAFVDLGNDIEGLLHISEITWDQNIKRPQDYLKLGDEIEVEVIELDFEKQKLRVSLKNLLPKPFDEFISNHKVGDILDGKVVTITEFGAFINIGLIDGLLHNEECSWEKGSKCKDLLKKGDEVRVKIIKIDKDKQTVSLSIKALQDSFATKFAKEHKVGDIVKAKIKSVKDFGIFLALNDNLDGLIRKEDLEKGKTTSDYEVGEEIEAIVVNIDEQKNKVRLSIRKVQAQKEKDELKKINNDSKMTLADVIEEKIMKEMNK